MPQASFVHTSQTLIFTLAPLRPPRSLDKVQPRELTAVDVPIVHDSLATDDLIDLTLRLTDAEREQFLFFWANSARGASNPFTYNTVAGTALTVKFNQISIAIREIAYNHHQVKVQLRVQP